MSLSFLHCKMIIIVSLHKAVVRTHCKGHNTCLKFRKSWKWLLFDPLFLSARFTNLQNIKSSFILLRSPLPWPVSCLTAPFPPPHLYWGSSTHLECVPSHPDQALSFTSCNITSQTLGFLSVTWESILPHPFTIFNTHSLSTHDMPGSQRLL